MFSICTDYAVDTGDPSIYLENIAEAGFTNIHWCHEWGSDHFYTPDEINKIQKKVKELGLTVLDSHGSMTPEKNWGSDQEDIRQAGLELVKNRINMTRQLGGDIMVMHILTEELTDSVRKSLDVIQPLAKEQGIRIAVENMSNGVTGSFKLIKQIFAEYTEDYIGLCYDAGHGHMTGDGLEHLNQLKGRLLITHLHDNDSNTDQHKLPFTGTLDWLSLTGVLTQVPSLRLLTFEVMTKAAGISDEKVFLKNAFKAAQQLTSMVK